jgi:hypothetical protein
LDNTWFPRKLAKSFGQLPGVMERKLNASDPAALKRTLLGSPVSAAPPPTADMVAPEPVPAG